MTDQDKRTFFKEALLTCTLAIAFSLTSKLIPSTATAEDIMSFPNVFYAAVSTLAPFLAGIPAGYIIGQKTTEDESQEAPEKTGRKKRKRERKSKVKGKNRPAYGSLIYPGVGTLSAIIIMLLPSIVGFYRMDESAWSREYENARSLLPLNVTESGNFTVDAFREITSSSFWLSNTMMAGIYSALGALGGFIGGRVFLLRKRALERT